MKSKLKPELLAALFPSTVEAPKLTPALYLQEIEKRGISKSVKDGRLRLSGGNEKEREQCMNILAVNPELEAKVILHEAVRNPDLLDEIQERACIRWSEGYSDSLYMAVLSGIVPTGEKKEYSAKPDMKQVEFLRRMGTPEADIMNKDKRPSVWVKLQERTDWEAEKRQYR